MSPHMAQCLKNAAAPIAAPVPNIATSTMISTRLGHGDDGRVRSASSASRSSGSRSCRGSVIGFGSVRFISRSSGRSRVSGFVVVRPVDRAWASNAGRRLGVHNAIAPRFDPVGLGTGSQGVGFLQGRKPPGVATFSDRCTVGPGRQALLTAPQGMDRGAGRRRSSPRCGRGSSPRGCRLDRGARPSGVTGESLESATTDRHACAERCRVVRVGRTSIPSCARDVQGYFDCRIRNSGAGPRLGRLGGMRWSSATSKTSRSR